MFKLIRKIGNFRLPIILKLGRALLGIVEIMWTIEESVDEENEQLEATKSEGVGQSSSSQLNEQAIGTKTTTNALEILKREFDLEIQALIIRAKKIIWDRLPEFHTEMEKALDDIIQSIEMLQFIVH